VVRDPCYVTGEREFSVETLGELRVRMVSQHNVPPTRVFCVKSVESLENKRVVIWLSEKESARI